MLIFHDWVGLPEWASLQWFHPFDSVRRLVFTTFTNKSGMLQQCLAINMRLPGLHQLFTGKKFQNAFQMFFQQEKQEMVLVLSLMRHVFVYWVRMVYMIYIYIHVSTVVAYRKLTSKWYCDTLSMVSTHHEVKGDRVLVSSLVTMQFKHVQGTFLSCFLLIILWKF